MEATQIFNVTNCIYWLILALVIAWQGATVGDVWPEQRRWMYGMITLFGSTLGIVLWAGWDGRTWAGLVLLSSAAWILRLDTWLIDDLWRRRESYRWTLRYTLAFMVMIPLLRDRAGEQTWLLMLISLGVCGAAKVAREGWQASRRARELRRQEVTLPEEYQDAFPRR